MVTADSEIVRMVTSASERVGMVTPVTVRRWGSDPPPPPSHLPRDREGGVAACIVAGA